MAAGDPEAKRARPDHEVERLVELDRLDVLAGGSIVICLLADQRLRVRGSGLEARPSNLGVRASRKPEVEVRLSPD